MPELALSYLVGFFIVLAVTAVVLLREARLERSGAFAVLGTNLAQVGARWSHSQDTIITVKAGEKKPLSHLQTLAIVGVACAFLSWFGLFFFILILVSLRFVVHKRRRQILLHPLSRQSFKEPVEVLAQMQNFLGENS